SEPFTRLYFLRHGQTLTHKTYNFNGWTDVALTEEGRRQLDEAAEALEGLEVDAVYSSDLERAAYGGRRLAKLLGAPHEVRKEFREMNFGLCEGLVFNSIKQAYPELAAQILDQKSQRLEFPQGETVQLFRARVEQAFKQLLTERPFGSKVVLVSHSGVNRALLGYFLKLSNCDLWTMEQDYACLNVADVYPNEVVRIRLVNGFLGPGGYYREGPGFNKLSLKRPLTDGEES
ncbi:MAG: histidine phosphatase family protein, partial [Deltaproteobacteria bacterium]|nr:histidine phosphatase family protein [Deltaproteobacteria bacterium]